MPSPSRRPRASERTRTGLNGVGGKRGSASGVIERGTLAAHGRRVKRVGAFGLAPPSSPRENHRVRALLTGFLLLASTSVASAQRAADDSPSPAPASGRYTGPAPEVLSGMGAWRRQVLNSGLEAWSVPFDRLARRPLRRRTHIGPNAVVNDATTDYEPRYPLMTYQVGPSVAAMGGNVLVGFSDSYGIQDFVTGVTSYGYSPDGGATWVDAGGLPRYGQTWSFVGDPVVTHDDAGNFYVSSIVFDYLGDFYGHDFVPGVAVGRGRFESGAFVWDTVTIVTEGRESFWDKEWIAADPATGE